MARLCGIVALFVGLNFYIGAVYYAANIDAAQRIDTGGLPPTLVYFVGGTLSIAIGIPMVTVKPFRPDLGDKAWTAERRRLGQTGHRKLSWWTGEPRA